MTSRRDFLASTAVIATGLALGPLSGLQPPYSCAAVCPRDSRGAADGAAARARRQNR